MSNTDISTGTGTVIGLDPTGTKRASPALAQRPSHLVGGVLGLVSNRKGAATAFLTALATELNSLGAGLADVILIEKESVFAAPDPADWQRLTSRATVAVTGYGG